MWGHIKTSSLIFQNQKLSLTNPTKSLMPPLAQLPFCTLSFPEELCKIQERARERARDVSACKKRRRSSCIRWTGLKYLNASTGSFCGVFYFGWRIESSINSCVVRKEIHLEKWVDVWLLVSCVKNIFSEKYIKIYIHKCKRWTK